MRSAEVFADEAHVSGRAWRQAEQVKREEKGRKQRRVGPEDSERQERGEKRGGRRGCLSEQGRPLQQQHAPSLPPSLPPSVCPSQGSEGTVDVSP